MSSTPIPFGTRLIGQTEKTLNAILGRLLVGSGVSESAWVALTVTLRGGATSRTTAGQRIATTLKVSPEVGAQVLGTLIDRGFAEAVGADEVAVTSIGREFHEAIERRIGEITTRVWGDIPTLERETAGAVLNTTLQRAGIELAALSR